MTLKKVIYLSLGLTVFGFLSVSYFFNVVGLEDNRIQMEMARTASLICSVGGLATFICAMSIWAYRREKRESEKGSGMTGEEAKEIFLNEFLRGSEMSREEAEILLREFFKGPDIKNKQKSYQERAPEIVRDLLKKGSDKKDIQRVLDILAKAHRKKPLDVHDILSS